MRLKKLAQSLIIAGLLLGCGDDNSSQNEHPSISGINKKERSLEMLKPKIYLPLNSVSRVQDTSENRLNGYSNNLTYNNKDINDSAYFNGDSLNPSSVFVPGFGNPKTFSLIIRFKLARNPKIYGGHLMSTGGYNSSGGFRTYFGGDGFLYLEYGNTTSGAGTLIKSVDFSSPSMWNVWHSLVIIQDSSSRKTTLWVDGNKNTIPTPSYFNPMYNLMIGVRPDNPGVSAFQGNMFDFMYFDKALMDNEVLDISQYSLPDFKYTDIKVTYDGICHPQCVEFVRKNLGFTTGGRDAKDYWVSPYTGYSNYENGKSLRAPRPGDILVWSEGINPSGHLAIVEKADVFNGILRKVDANWKNDCTINSMGLPITRNPDGTWFVSAKHLLGWQSKD